MTLRLFGPVRALWRREILRFVRQRSRVTGAFLQPLVFWALLGGGLNASFQPAGTPVGTSYVAYFYPGTIALVLLFTAIFATISIVEDRRSGFLQGVLVAPVPRWAIVLGQAVGATTLAVLQGVLFLLFAPLVGVSLTPGIFLGSFFLMIAMGLALTCLGLIIAWRMDSTQGFHAVMNLLLLPIWFLSGAFFPVEGAPLPLRFLMMVNPLTYGVAALRRCLLPDAGAALAGVPDLAVAVPVTLLFAVTMFVGAVITAERRVL